MKIERGRGFSGLAGVRATTLAGVTTMLAGVTTTRARVMNTAARVTRRPLLAMGRRNAVSRLLFLTLFLFAFLGGAKAEHPATHWPGFDYHGFGAQGALHASIMINGEPVDINYPDWDQLEVAAFVGDELRMTAMFLTDEYLIYGELFPTLNAEAIYYTTPDETVTFKLYNHATGVEYDVCEPVIWDGDPITIKTGEEHWEGFDDPDHPLMLNFISPEPSVTYNVTMKEGTADAAKWKAKAGEATEFSKLPLTGVAEGEKVTLQYEGRKRVMSVRATKKVPWDGDLSKLTGSEPEGYATATNGMTITGTLADGVNVKVTIAEDATVTLSGATIEGTSVEDAAYYHAGITCLGNATIVLSGTNSVKGFYEDYPGIHVPENKTLTISGDGSLDAKSNGYGAGIGGGWTIPCGNITIEGGSITATGGENAAGIGGGDYASCGDIRITGGTVNAKGGIWAAGIGGGFNASCGDITITSGVTKVTATKGEDNDPNSIGKGFGPKAECGTVTIGCTLGTDGNPVAGTGTVYWDGSDYVNGGATYLSQSPLTYPEPIDLSTLTADYTAQDGATLTGTLKKNVKISIADKATVTLKDATISGVNDENCEWAGLTCLGDAMIVLVGTNKVKGFHKDYPGIHVPQNKTLTIQGDGSLDASSNDCGCGIGGGYGISCGNITIEGGCITATGGFDAAGIGGGDGASCGDILITGGTVKAEGGSGAAGIGSGNEGRINASCGNILITGGTVEAKGGGNAAGIGGGYDATCGDITITSSVTKVSATKGSIGAPCSIGKGYGDKAKCGTVTIGCTIGTDDKPVAGTGTVYWDGSDYVNGGDTYLTQSPLTYPEPPKLGDLYYSDGTWSSTSVEGKTAIGVIAYLGTDAFTETGTTVGGSTFTGHGLVLCLKNAASKVKWSTEKGAYEFGSEASVDDVDDLKRMTDVSGYTNTTTLAAKADAETKYPAAWQAKNYAGLAAPATGTTGWFLPSAQQWVKMMTGLGGLAKGDITWDSWFNNDHSAATAWETAMAKAGTKGTDYDSVTDNFLWYWSSSECSALSAVGLAIEATGTGGFYWGYASKSYSENNLRVRPVLAF